MMLNVTFVTETVSLFVIEEVYEDYMMGDMMMEMEEEKKAPIGLIVAIVVIVLLAKRCRCISFHEETEQEKAEKLLEDDLLEIEEDENKEEHKED